MLAFLQRRIQSVQTLSRTFGRPDNDGRRCRDGLCKMIGIRYESMGSKSRLGAFAKLGARSCRRLCGHFVGGRRREFPDAYQFKAG